MRNKLKKIQKNKTFKDVPELTTNEAKEAPRPKGMNHQCKICKKLFRSPYKLRVHMVTHTGERKFECGLCEKKFAKKDVLSTHLKIHMANVHTANVTCSICGIVSKNAFSLKQHMRRHTADKSFQCSVCGKAFVYKCDMIRHIDGVHNKQRKNSKDLPSFNCAACLKGFTRKPDLIRHLQIHLKKLYKCPFCPRSFKMKKFAKAHVDSHFQAEIPCAYCSKTFAKTSYLKQHISRRHRGLPFDPKVTPLHCTICSEEYPDFHCLEQHVLVHLNEKSYTCEICLKKFLTKHELYVHRKDVHKFIDHGQQEDTARSYTCLGCEKTFRRRSDYMDHLLKHTNAHNFECQQCPQKFQLKCGLTRHIQVIHEKIPTQYDQNNEFGPTREGKRSYLWNLSER
ncbi:hypothetical protein DMENIID0001_050190 [Sergentomyia squamirostris]